VKLSTTINRVFALLAIVGLVLAPLAPRAMAIPSQIQDAMSEHSAADAHMGMAMPVDMLMGLCMASVLQPPPLAPALFIPMTVASIVFPGDDASLSGLAQPPPARPPKA